MTLLKKYWRECVVLLFILANVFAWQTLYLRSASGALNVYFIDVGQGDAVLIESPTRGRVLVDGGANRSILRELGRILPFGDKRIDVLLATHPDADHIGGLLEVVSRYDIGLFLETGMDAENDIDDELWRRLEGREVTRLLARRGMALDLGDGALVRILFPDRDVSDWDPNDASVVARLDYGEDSFLLTGDAEIKTENLLLRLGEDVLDTDVLKVGHHGSKTSSTWSFIKAVEPMYAVISAGKDNRYGHPHQSVLDTLSKVNAKILSTSELGTIHMRSFGSGVEIK